MQRSFGIRLPLRFAVCLGLYALAGGWVSFLGWAADIPRLTDWDGHGISIQPNTALTVMLAGCGLTFLACNLRAATALCGALVALIGGSVLFQYLAGIDLGIDSLLLFGRDWGQQGVTHPGRMGLPAAISWACIG